MSGHRWKYNINIPDNYSDCKHGLTSLMMYIVAHNDLTLPLAGRSLDLIFPEYLTQSILIPVASRG